MSVSRRVSMKSGEVREFGGGGVATGIRAFADQHYTYFLSLRVVIISGFNEILHVLHAKKHKT